MITFPKDFFRGATSTAYCVEGGAFDSDWWAWEQRPGRIAGDADSRVAADHWNRFKTDFALARQLGHDAHLLSLEWSRIEPEPGRYDDEALTHYEQVLAALHAEGLEPVVALQEVTLPIWAADAGGWRNPSLAGQFASYTRTAVARLRGLCRWWLPMRAPVRWLEAALMEGAWPPGKSAVGTWRGWQSLAAAHAKASRAIREAAPDARVGLDLYAATVPPLEEDNPWEVRAARREEARLLDWPLAWHTGTGSGPDRPDFLALTYAGARQVRFSPWRPARLFTRCCDAAGRRTDPLEAPPSADGLLGTLRRLRAHDLPVLVAGVPLPPDHDDTDRCRALLDHAVAVDAARTEGTRVIGFLPAPLLDGFEWTSGYTARYGLIHVDRRTLARTPNMSAYLLKDLFVNGEIHDGTVAKFCPGWRPTGKDTP
jgi:beta-glucosidase